MATSSRSLATVVWVLAVGVPLGTAAQPTHDQSHARSTTNAYEVGAVVVVDDVQDRVFEGVRDDGSANVRGTSSAPHAREVVCSVTAGSPPQPITSATGHGCTLRGALELALAMSDIPVLILLKAGRFRLAAPLPELKGRIQLIGSEPLKGNPPASAPASSVTEQVRSDDADTSDGFYRPRPMGDASAALGQSSAIGTTLDGDARFQILRLALHANLRLERMRLENGRALDGSGVDQRASLGGALNALGSVVMRNVAFRGNRARNGGAIYTEADLHVSRAGMEYNYADGCGGFIYAAGRAEIISSAFDSNGCGRVDCRIAVSELGGDTSGAVSQGPALTDLTPQRLPFSQQPEGEQKKKIRMKTSNQLRQVFADLRMYVSSKATKEELRELAWEHDAVRRHDEIHGRAGGSTKPKRSTAPSAPGQQAGARGKRAEEGGEKAHGGQEAAEEAIWESAEESEEFARTSEEETQALFEELLAISAMDEQTLKKQLDDEQAAITNARKIRQKTVRQLREILVELEVEAMSEDEIQELTKEELQALAVEHDALRKYDEMHGRMAPPVQSEYADVAGFVESTERFKQEKQKRVSSESSSPPPPPCDAESHGGRGGAVHELTCEVNMWRSGRKQPSECLRWRATRKSECDPDGEWDQANDLGCFDFVPSGSPGYCECAGDRTAASSTCEHEPFTCHQMCKRAREERKRRRLAERREGGGSIVGTTPQNKIFVIGAYGKAGAFVDGMGLICSDGSRTAVAGAKPEFGMEWEFVCPGWSVCKDESEHCESWAKAGECKTNPSFMLTNCSWSCNACPDEPRVALDALGVVALDLRGGRMVDAVRLQCGNALGELGAQAWKGDEPTVSPWFGGDGGYECQVDCDGTNHTSGMRMGGIMQGATVKAGDHVDSIELTRCSEDVEDI